jgi:hypothetical protein
MEDIYVVSADARERLLAAAEQDEDRYVVRAGLEPGLLGQSGLGGSLAPFDPPLLRDRSIVVTPASYGRE